MGSHIVMGDKLVGEISGALEIIAFEGLKTKNSGHRVSMYRVKCLICGAEQSISLSNLHQNRGYGCKFCVAPNKSHGGRNDRLYNIWVKIKGRCLNPKDKAYPKYGGRGISMCDEWQRSYPSFRNWSLLNGYADNLSIDRIDNDGGYSPNNCRWATRITQNRNKSNTRMITFGEETLSLAEWADRTGISHATLFYRLKRGWDVERTFTTPTDATNLGRRRKR